MAEGKSSKEVRTLLKKAKLSVDKTDYVTAVEQLDSVLLLEPDNCNGLLLKAFVLMKQGDCLEAEKVLWNVVRLQEGLVSGWQGLKELYEREGGTETRKDKEYLCEVYTKLLNLYSDENKKFTILEKLSILLLRLDRKSEALNYFISYFSLCIEQSKQQQICKHWEQVIDICVNRISERTFKEIFPKLQNFYLNLSENGFTEEIIFPYFTMLYTNIFSASENCEIFTPHIIDVISQLNTEIPEKFICFAREMLFVFSLTSYSELKRCEFVNNSVLAELLDLIRQGKFIESFEKIYLLSEFEKSIIPGKLANLKCLFGVYQFQELTEFCYKELGVINRNKQHPWFQLWYKNEVLLALANCNLEMEEFKECEKNISELNNLDPNQENDLKFIKISLLNSEKRFEDALSLFETMDGDLGMKWNCLKADILSQSGCIEKSIELLKSLRSENDNSAVCHFSLGLCYWRSGVVAREDKDLCLRSFLRAFSLDQLNYKPMLYIGTYYSTISLNLTKSRKCLEKACQLAPWCNKAGQLYGDLLIDLRQEDYALDFYRELSRKISPNTGKWVWVRLGLSERKARNFSEAIRCFQNALNCDENDPRVLECLGEVYLVRGSLLGALASFEAVLRIEQDNLFCLYQTGCIKTQSGELCEAVSVFQKVLQLNTTYVPALLSAAECHYQLSVQSIDQGLRPVALSHLEQGLELSARCCELTPEYVSVWLRIGEIGMLGRHFDKHTEIHTTSTNIFPNLQNNTVRPFDLLQLSIRSFEKCVTLSPHHSTTLYLLALAHYYSAANIELSYKHCVNAIILNNTDYKYWNLLGLILLSRETKHTSLIKHSFVKSLSLQSDHHTWTNLGYLYLSEREYELALKCFENAKSTEPLSVYPWIGLSLVAQAFNREKQSVGFLRHMNGMGYQEQAALLFGWKVCQILSQSDRSDGRYGDSIAVKREVVEYVLLARDRLYHYNLHHPTDARASNMLAVLYEAEGMYQSAVETYAIALNLLDPNSEEYVKVGANLLRVSNKARRMEFDNELLLKLPKSPSNTLQHSVHLFYTKNYTDSLSLLNDLMKQLECEEDKSDVKLLIGLVANQARDQRLANGTLAKLSKEKFPLSACAALCCIGFVYGNLKLVEGSVTQMHEVSCGDWGAPPCHNLPKVVLILECLLLHYSSDVKTNNSDLIKKLTDLVAQLSPKECDISVERIKLLSDLQNGHKPLLCESTPPKHVTAFVQREETDQSEVELEMPSVEKQVIPKPKELVSVSTTDLLKRAQKLIHSNPNDVTNWVNLVVSVSCQIWLSPNRRSEIPFMTILTLLLRSLMEKYETIPQLNSWCMQTYIPLRFHFKRFGVSFEEVSAVPTHPLVPVYRALESLTPSPDAGVLELCKNKFQTQIAIARHLSESNSYIPALNSYKAALLLGKSISNQCMVFVLVEMALQSICWYKQCVRCKARVPQEVNLHKIAKDNLAKSKQIFPEISELTELLKQANEDLHSELYTIVK